VHLIDLWNVIEMFRDSNLHTLDIFSEIDSLKLEACIKNMYIQLNKRLAFNQQINVDMQTSLLLAWLLNLYDKSRFESIRVISFKVALTTLCAGKLLDKLKCKWPHLLFFFVVVLPFINFFFLIIFDECQMYSHK
jgi:hypothetical protein